MSSEKCASGGRLAEFSDSSVSLVYGLISVCSGCGVGICNDDSSEAFPRNVAGPLSLRPIGIPKGVVFVRVAVWPAIDGDGRDVARGIEAARRQDARQLIANLVLESFKASRQ